MFDATINLGNVITLIAFVGGGVTFIWVMKINLAVLGVRVDNNIEQIKEIQNEIKEMGNILKQVSDQKARLDVADERQLAQGRRIDDLMREVRDLRTA